MPLQLLHEQLDLRFADLRERREHLGASVFALEHDLDEAQLSSLNEAVRHAVATETVGRRHWLPVVVYATEVGYSYSGDEYWPSFEEQTPRWMEAGSREWIRDWFGKFETTYSGAKPRGAWAQNFSIISRPITNAILPKDLQRQLARLLFESRGYLTPKLLGDSDRLGVQLAARAWNASARFRVFCENTEILGRVSAGLLSDQDEMSPYLDKSVLRRIVRDLSAERQAQAWLKSAQKSVTRMRLAGPIYGGAAGAPEGEQKDRAPSRLDLLRPTPSLRRHDGAWRPFLEFPDFTALTELAPEVAEELESLRAMTPYAPDAPIKRGRLMYPGQEVLIECWPQDDEPVLQLEGGSDHINEILAEQVRKLSAERCLFEVGTDGIGIHVKSERLRPGRTYVLLSRDDLPTRRPDWMAQVDVKCADVSAYEITVPERLDQDDLRQMSNADLTVAADIDVFPAGLPPAEWDGDGYAAWLTTDDPMLGLSSTLAVETIDWQIDNNAFTTNWPEGETYAFVSLGNLSVGSHKIGVSLVGAGSSDPISATTFEADIRDPGSRLDSGSPREGVMLVPAPTSPTLAELWEGRADIQLLGPLGAGVEVEVQLLSRSNGVLASNAWTANLPLASQDWENGFSKHVRNSVQMHDAYDGAEAASILVSRAGIGRVIFRCEREFSALRWICSRSRSEQILRLIDNTDGKRASVEFFPFETPDRPEVIELDGDALRTRKGGLAVARTESLAEAMIAPRPETRLHGFGALGVSPKLNVTKKSKQGVEGLLKLYEKWWGAAVPGNPLALTAKSMVLRAISERLTHALAGAGWADFEVRFLDEGLKFPMAELQNALGNDSNARRIAPRLDQLALSLAELGTGERAALLSRALADYAPTCGIRASDMETTEVLLKLASAPQLIRTASPGSQLIAQIFECPLLFRAARFFVLQVSAAVSEPNGEEIYGGWKWQ